MRRSPFADELAQPRTVVEQQERVGPTDDRNHVADTLAEPNRWICSIESKYRDKSKTNHGSGVFISPRLVLTAAHCIWLERTTEDERFKSPSSVVVIPARNGRTDPLGRVRAVAYRVVPDVPDLAVVLVERGFDTRRHKALGNQPLGYWGRMGSLKPSRQANVPVTVRGYPGDRCGTAKFDPDSGATCPPGDQASTLWTCDGVATIVSKAWVAHTADTYHGDSGAPVWTMIDGQPCLVAIHSRPGRVGVFNLAAHLNPSVLATLRAWRK